MFNCEFAERFIEDVVVASSTPFRNSLVVPLTLHTAMCCHVLIKADVELVK
jgi:hypothetical protein